MANSRLHTDAGSVSDWTLFPAPGALFLAISVVACSGTNFWFSYSRSRFCATGVTLSYSCYFACVVVRSIVDPKLENESQSPSSFRDHSCYCPECYSVIDLSE